MRSLLATFFFIFLASNLYAFEIGDKKLDINLYGTVYGYVFYEHYDKYSSDHSLDTNRIIAEPSPYSFVGINGSIMDIDAKFELSLDPEEIIRQLYLKYNISDETFILIGRTSSIDAYDLSQVTYEMNALVNYGALSVHRKPMVLLQTHGFKVSFSPLDSASFINFADGSDIKDIRDDKYIPHMEVAYRLERDTFALNFFGSIFYSSSTVTYNNNDIKTYGLIVSHIGSGGKVEINDFIFEYVVFGAMNAGLDQVLTKESIIPRYNDERRLVDNVFSFGGAINLGYNLTEKVLLQLGFGSAVHTTRSYNHPDVDFGVYINSFITLNKYLTVIPEIAYLDDMVNGYGDREGARIYGGAMLMLEF